MRMVWAHKLGGEGKETDIAFMVDLLNMAVICNRFVAISSLGSGPVNTVDTANNVYLVPREQSLVFFLAEKSGDLP